MNRFGLELIFVTINIVLVSLVFLSLLRFKGEWLALVSGALLAVCSRIIISLSNFIFGIIKLSNSATWVDFFLSVSAGVVVSLASCGFALVFAMVFLNKKYTPSNALRMGISSAGSSLTMSALVGLSSAFIVLISGMSYSDNLNIRIESFTSPILQTSIVTLLEQLLSIFRSIAVAIIATHSLASKSMRNMIILFALRLLPALVDAFIPHPNGVTADLAFYHALAITITTIPIVIYGFNKFNNWRGSFAANPVSNNISPEVI